MCEIIGKNGICVLYISIEVERPVQSDEPSSWTPHSSPSDCLLLDFLSKAKGCTYENPRLGRVYRSVMEGWGHSWVGRVLAWYVPGSGFYL